MDDKASDKNISSSGICLSAVLLTKNDDARRLLETPFGTEPALTFCLKRWTAAQRPVECLLLIPAALEQPWRSRIAAAASAHGVRLILAQEENLVASLAQTMQQAGAHWIAIIPATSPFVDGNTIDACLGILSRSSADYVYGAAYPLGMRPLAVRREVVNMLAARVVPVSPHRDGVTLLLQSLSFFHGIALPAPSQLQIPDLDLSLTSDQRATDLEAVFQHLISKKLPLTTDAIVQEMHKRQQVRLRAIFRLARKRPRQRESFAGTAAGILCLCLRSEKLSGGDTSLSNLITELDRSRFRPLLAAPSTSGTLVDVWRQHGAATISVPLLATSVPLLAQPNSNLSEMLLAAVRLARFARHNRANLIYANNTAVSCLGAITAFMLGLPLVARVIEQLGRRALEAYMIALADRVVVPSRYMAAYCQDIGIPAERLRVVYEGIDSSWLAPAPEGENLRRRCAFPERASLIGVVSRLDDPKKALDHAIRAAAQIVAERPDVRMVICGKTGAGRALRQIRLERLIEQLGIKDHVRMAGFFPNMRAVYPQFDLLLHPAPREPFGLVLTEAMAMGVPPVAVRGGGVPEQVLHGETGLLVERSDPHLLAQAALRLLEQPTLRHRLGQQAREHVRRHFTSEQFARAVEAVFDELLCNLASEQ